VRHSVFTVELCARLDVAPALLEELRPLVQLAPEQATRDEAWQRHAAAANVLLRAIDILERGCWEYFDDEAHAKAMFDDWCRPVLEREVPRQGPSGMPGYREAGPRYLLFTFVYLLAHDSPTDLAVRDACDVPDDALWRRDTFRGLLGAVRTLSFASVKGDAMYMVPREQAWGLTQGDLAMPTYEYLRMIQP
jgi:hypothetical protein